MAAADCADDTDAAVSIGAQLISYNTATFYASGTRHKLPKHSRNTVDETHSQFILNPFSECSGNTFPLFFFYTHSQTLSTCTSTAAAGGENDRVDERLSMKIAQ